MSKVSKSVASHIQSNKEFLNQNSQKLSTSTSNALKSLLAERAVPKERAAVLNMMAENIDVIQNDSLNNAKDIILQRVPNANELVKATGLKQVIACWENGSVKSVRDMMFKLVGSKKFSSL